MCAPFVACIYVVGHKYTRDDTWALRGPPTVPRRRSTPAMVLSPRIKLSSVRHLRFGSGMRPCGRGLAFERGISAVEISRLAWPLLVLARTWLYKLVAVALAVAALRNGAAFMHTTRLLCG